ncbi:isoprenylcysteine carboxylmethyltransferase family protein [Flavobacteriaceae bacterium TP-CH-4]|uniref:Isoprenylcysteine carboxylmethyltransferase family protein n=1 Tax=Pelagihabitans pacificus TaxID=2696054 RepID=A0A967E6N6_9FLAO|nr:isoprenylcysteine carboxylmethyltransferase family protein [Pelagihabitans pacificus]NHF59359.1 isoprenylcysteine carboxylmethyltransferase family protein [Pelagihabitans pacificus]
MKLKIPPALVFLFFGVLMYLLAEFLPVGYFDFFGRKYLIIALLVLSVVFGVGALFHFFGSKTTIDPMLPSKASNLVTTGLYRFSRNPMYLALLLVLLAWGIWLGNAFNTLVAAGFVGYMNRYQIIPEEEALTKLFGREYVQYCVKVRRWF